MRWVQHAVLPAAGAAVMVFAVGLGRLGQIGPNVPSLRFLYLVGFLGFGVIVWQALSPPPWPRWLLALLLAVGVSARVPLIGVQVSDDVYRYLWEGRIQNHGFNPYRLPPDSPKLARAGLRNRYYPPINHKHWATIYPPLAQVVFRTTARLGPSPLGFKLMVLLFDLLTLGGLLCLLRSYRRPARWVLIYAMNPLVLLVFAAEAHYDSLLLAEFVWILWAARRKRPLGISLALAAAILTKTVAVLWLPPFFFRRRLVVPLTLLWTVLGYLPYVGAGPGLWRSLLRFGGESYCNDSVCALVRFAFDVGGLEDYRARLPNILCLGIAAVAMLLIARRKPSFVRYAYQSLAVFIILSPTVHPWYVTWLLPILCLRPRVAWLVLAGTVIGYYQAAYLQHITGRWFLPVWISGVIYGPFYIALAVELAILRSRHGRARTVAAG